MLFLVVAAIEGTRTAYMVDAQSKYIKNNNDKGPSLYFNLLVVHSFASSVLFIVLYHL